MRPLSYNHFLSEDKLPTIREILGKVVNYVQPQPKKRRIKAPITPEGAICTDMLVIYEWLEQNKHNAPFYCLMLQEQFDTSFFLTPDGTPAIFKKWDEVIREKEDLNNPNVWILEFTGVAN